MYSTERRYLIHSSRKEEVEGTLSRRAGTTVEFNSSIWGWGGGGKDAFAWAARVRLFWYHFMGKLRFAQKHTRVCFDRFTRLPGITRISWRRFRTRIMINACSAKPRTSLALQPSYIIFTRPDECFRPRRSCETAMSKIAIRAVIRNEFVWFILGDWSSRRNRTLDEQRFRYVSFERKSVGLTQFVTFGKWKTHIIVSFISLDTLITLNRLRINNM